MSIAKSVMSGIKRMKLLLVKRGLVYAMIYLKITSNGCHPFPKYSDTVLCSLIASSIPASTLSQVLFLDVISVALAVHVLEDGCQRIHVHRILSI